MINRGSITQIPCISCDTALDFFAFLDYNNIKSRFSKSRLDKLEA